MKQNHDLLTKLTTCVNEAIQDAHRETRDRGRGSAAPTVGPLARHPGYTAAPPRGSAPVLRLPSVPPPARRHSTVIPNAHFPPREHDYRPTATAEIRGGNTAGSIQHGMMATSSRAQGVNLGM